MLSLRLTNTYTAPESVSALAAANGVSRPISMRGLLTRLGSRSKTIRVALVRYVWQNRNPPNPKSPLSLSQWNDATSFEVFAARNGWSVSDYWRRVTFGLLDVQVVLFPWRMLPGNQASLDTKRGAVASLVRGQATTDGVPLDQFDRMIALIHPPPGDRGAVGVNGDVILDEIGPGSDDPPAWLEFFEHETGHLLGFDHAFGPSANPKPYQDNFCVMGYTGPFRHAILPQPNLPEIDATIGPGNIWFSGRRLAVANLYRTKDIGPAFAATPSVVRVKPVSVQVVRLLAASEAGLGDPVLAVMTTGNGEVTLEYRVKTGDDAGVSPAPCLVMHSIGRRTLAKDATGHSPGEINPVVFEGSCDATVGSAMAISDGDVVVSVVGVSANGRSVSLQIQCL